jgi:hypothetical protein
MIYYILFSKRAFAKMGLRLTKQTLNALIDAPGIDAALMIEDRQQIILLETGDHREAVAAFRDGDIPPIWIAREAGFEAGSDFAAAAALFAVAKRLSNLLEFELLNLAARGARQIRHQLDAFRPKLLGHLAFGEVGRHFP